MGLRSIADKFSAVWVVDDNATDVASVMQSLARPYVTVRCAHRQDRRKADDPIFALQGSEKLPARCLAPFHISQGMVDVTHPNLRQYSSQTPNCVKFLALRAFIHKPLAHRESMRFACAFDRELLDTDVGNQG